MKVSRRRVIRALRPGARPRPPEGLLDRLKEDVPQGLFSAPTSDDRLRPGPGRLTRWAVAASLLLVGLSALLAVRFLRQDSEGAWRPPAAEEAIGEASTRNQGGSRPVVGAEIADVARRGGRVEGEAEQPPAGAAPALAEDQRMARAELRARQKDLPEQGPVASPPPPLEPPAAAVESAPSRAPVSTAAQREELGAQLGEEQIRQEAFADEGDRRDAADRDSDPAAAKVAAPRLDSVESRARAQGENEGKPGAVSPLTLEALRWRNDTLLIRGRAAVDGDLEIRLVGTGRTETRRVEAGRSFEFGLEDLGDTRRVELRLVGWGESWSREIPSP